MQDDPGAAVPSPDAARLPLVACRDAAVPLPGLRPPVSCPQPLSKPAAAEMVALGEVPAVRLLRSEPNRAEQSPAHLGKSSVAVSARFRLPVSGVPDAFFRLPAFAVQGNRAVLGVAIMAEHCYCGAGSGQNRLLLPHYPEITL